MGRRCGHCYYCNRELLPGDARLKSGVYHDRARSRDHAIPRVEGGTRTVLSCRACDNMKADLPLSVWLDFIAEHPRWWKHYPTTAKTIIGREHGLRSRD